MLNSFIHAVMSEMVSAISRLHKHQQIDVYLMLHKVRAHQHSSLHRACSQHHLEYRRSTLQCPGGRSLACPHRCSAVAEFSKDFSNIGKGNLACGQLVSNAPGSISASEVSEKDCRIDRGNPPSFRAS